tara:strand:- start:522 stop:896 length:375 start_codon:yes stop_codon:yes gene_type:complete
MFKMFTTLYENLIKSGVSVWVANQMLGALCFTNVKGAQYTARNTADKLAEAKEASEEGNDDRLCKLVAVIERNDAQEAEFLAAVEAAKKAFKTCTGSEWVMPSKSTNSPKNMTDAHAFLKKRTS